MPPSGSVIPMPQTAAPEIASGRYRWRCSALPFRATLFTNRIAWARYARQKPGSEVDSSSCTIAAATASMPAPPSSAGTVSPSRSSAPNCAKELPG